MQLSYFPWSVQVLHNLFMVGGGGGLSKKDSKVYAVKGRGGERPVHCIQYVGRVFFQNREFLFLLYSGQSS